MFSQLKLFTVKKVIPKFLIFLIAGIYLVYGQMDDIMSFYYCEDITEKWPENFSERSFVSIDMGKAYTLGAFLEQYYSKDREKLAARYYIVAIKTEEGLKYVAVRVEKTNLDRFEKLSEETMKSILDNKAAQKEEMFILKGSVHEMEKETRDAYEKFLSVLKLSEVDKEMSVEYFVIGDRGKREIIFSDVMLGCGILVILFDLIYLIRAICGSRVKKIKVYLKNKSAEEICGIEKDFEMAEAFTENVRVGKYFTYVYDGGKIEMIDNSDIVWVYKRYFYSKKGKLKRINVVLFSKNKDTECTIKMRKKEELSDRIVEYYANISPTILIGYTEENRHILMGDIQ